VRDKGNPWIKWYPSDWRSDSQLRLCSLEARGLWIDLLGFMHEAVPRGFLLINGEQPTDEELADLCGIRKVATVTRCLAELERRQVFSRDEAGRIYSRRMVRDEETALRDKANGRDGGNPLLKPPDNAGVNPPIKAQKPEARSQISEQKQRRSRAPAAPAALPAWVPQDEWGAFDRMRTADGAKRWTEDAKRYALNTLEKLRAGGQLPAAVLRQSVERGWSGLFAVKADRATGPPGLTLAEKRSQGFAAIIGRERNERVIEADTGRVGGAIVRSLPSDLREQGGDDVGGGGPGRSAAGVG
jgi:hypothetical protein